MPTPPITPLKDLQVLKHQIPAHGLIPNTSIQQKPLLIYKKAFLEPPWVHPTSIHTFRPFHYLIEGLLKDIGVVEPNWRFTMFETTHFHSNTHEVLVVSQGSAELCFGGEENPGRVEVEVEKGDVIVIPAGVGHRLLSEGPGGFHMVGSYPKGAEKRDMCYGEKGEEEKVKRIEGLGLFERDPVYGGRGPVLDV